MDNSINDTIASTMNWMMQVMLVKFCFNDVPHALGIVPTNGSLPNRMLYAGPNGKPDAGSFNGSPSYEQRKLRIEFETNSHRRPEELNGTVELDFFAHSSDQIMESSRKLGIDSILEKAFAPAIAHAREKANASAI